MTRHAAGVASVLVALLLLTLGAEALALPSRKGSVELRGPGSLGTVQLAGRVVPDLAAKDRVLVGLRPGLVGTSAEATVARAVKGRVVHRIGGFLLVVDLPENSDILSAAATLALRPEVAFAEPDRVVYTTLTPNDPEYASQPHLPKIECPAAWDIGTGSSDVVLAVVDSGVDTDHPDLRDSIWTNVDEIAGNGLDDDDNGFVDDVRGWDFYDEDNSVDPVPNGIDENHDGDPDEQVSHGTLVAGLAAARGNNGFGAVGVTWRATIMPVKVFGDDGTTYVSTVVDGMNYAVDNGCFIMNLSIGAPYETSFTAPIVALWNKGGLTVSAAGNEGREFTDSQSTWTSPSCNDGNTPLTQNMVLGVGGLTLQDRKASWSNYDGTSGRHFVDVFAPGVDLYGPGVYYPSVSGFGSYFTTNSGTSFASPLAAGLAALLKAQNPLRTGADIISIMRSACDSIDALNPGYVGKLGAGRINAARAMGASLPLAAPTNVQASDTAGDQGGSITLQWDKSTDDGSGANSVTQYVIVRADGSLPGETATAQIQVGWRDIAYVSKGVTQYLDNTTTDGVSYYYKVGAVSASDRADSEPVGPVFSFDDSAPARVDTLTAYDRPLDSGGVIELDWTGYSAPSDLARFNVYRALVPFSSVRLMAPLAVVSSPQARNYTDLTALSGVDYYYAVVAVDDKSNLRYDVVAVGPVQSFSNGPVTLPAGLQMIGTPAVPSDAHPATLFGIATTALKYARYDSVTQTHIKYSGEPLSDFLELALGRGFWIQFPSAVTFTPTGSVAPAGGFSVDLSAGWQQVSNPFFSSMDFSASTVTYGGNTMDLDAADALGVMGAYAWVFDPATGDYALRHPILGASTTITPWQAFWVLVDQHCTLAMTRKAGASAVSPATAAAVSADDWPIQIIARSSGAVDAANYFGVSGAVDSVGAPPAVGGLDLHFVGTNGPSEARLAAAFESSERPSMSWEFVLSWNAPQGAVRLSWPDLSKVPGDYSLALEDLDTGRRVSMRHTTVQTVQADAPSGTRHFRIVATQSADKPIQITSASVQSTGVGAQIAFSLSADATCDVEVLNIAGRSIGVVESSRVRAAGTNVAVWNGRNSAGSRAPAGVYLFRVTARAQDGTATSALRSVQVRR